MKKFFILHIFMCFFYCSTPLLAQLVIKGDCATSIKIVSEPPYDPNLYAGNSVNATNKQPCSAVLVSWTSNTLKPRYRMQRKNAQGSWENITTPTFFGGWFTGLSHGTYRLLGTYPAVSIPAKSDIVNCPEGINIIDSKGAKIGKTGFFPNASVTSNEVVVGPAIQSDIQAKLVETMQNTSNQVYCKGEEVVLSTAGSNNYTDYWLAIFENGGANRYVSQGWRSGSVPSNINLKALWKLYTGTDFAESGPNGVIKYGVQYAITNGPCNASWITLPVSSLSFQVQPAGWACRKVGEEVTISLNPNPSSSFFRLDNLDADNGAAATTILVNDLSGRVAKQFNQVQSQYEIEDLANGLYVVSVIQDNKRVFSSKLSVVK